MQSYLFADLTNRKLTNSLGGAPVTFPPFVQGDQARIGLRFAESVEGSVSEVVKNVISLTASIGFIDARPTSGFFVLRIGNAPYVQGTNQTAPVSFDATAAALNAALATIGLTSVTVIKDSGSWLVSNAGAAIALTGASSLGLASQLSPSSFVNISETISGGLYSYEVRLTQSPLASTSAFDLIVPPPPSVSLVQAGGVESTFVWPEIQALKIPQNFRGTYQIQRNYKKTVELSVDDGPEEIATALAALADEDGVFTVTNPNVNIAHITFGGSMAGIEQSLLTIVVFSAPPGDPTFVLNLNTAEVAAALRLNDEIKPFLELQIFVEDENNDSIAYFLTPYRAPIVLIREMNSEGLEVAGNIDWLRPPHGESYIPFTNNQIITGAQNYVTPIGNGTATSITLTHNLGTRNLHVTVRRNGGNRGQITPTSVLFATDNTLTLTFATAPTSNEFIVVASTAGPESVFQEHTHTIDQIENLNNTLIEIFERIGILEGIVAAPGATGSNAVGEDLVITLPAVDLTVPAMASVNARPPLLGAIHDASVAVTSPPYTTVVADANQVRQTNAAWVIPSTRNRREWPVENSSYVASNGEVYYEVRKSGNSYFPVEFEHDLLMLWVSDAMFPTKREFNLNALPILQLLGNTRAQYVLEVAFGTIVGDSNPNFAVNFSSITWGTPIISERFLISSAIIGHPINVIVSHSSNAVLSATASIYGRKQTVSPPASNEFALRARLLNFDTENRSNTRGVVKVNMAETIATISLK